MRLIWPARSPGSDLKRAEPSGNGRLNGNGSSTGHSNGKTKIRPRPVLGPGASAELSERLVAQIAEIGSADDAALWAYCNMRAKNGLNVADAHQVEEAFEGKLAGLGSPTERVSLDGQDAAHARRTGGTQRRQTARRCQRALSCGRPGATATPAKRTGSRGEAAPGQARQTNRCNR